jgi:hypothetical protein
MKYRLPAAIFALVCYAASLMPAMAMPLPAAEMPAAQAHHMRHHEATPAEGGATPTLPAKICQDHCMMSAQAIVAPAPTLGAVSWESLRLAAAADPEWTGRVTAPDPYPPRGRSEA